MSLRFLRLLTLALLLSALAACGGDDVTPPPDTDGGTTDAALRDGGTGVDGGDARSDAGDCRDEDGDGHGSLPCGDDCDDTDATRFPGNTEICDGDDEDCDDTTYGPDSDSDGFPSNMCCNGTDNCGADCNDTLNTVNPGAAEQCNGGVDDDCDGLADAADGVCVPCPTGYAGFDGGCEDLNECAVAGFCGTGGTACVNSAGTFSCSCGPGFFTAAPMGAQCEDIDECAAATSPCGAGSSTCSNFAGSYACSCRVGYGTSGPGTPCIDVDECAAGMCGSGAASCANTAGSYACTCASGYTVAGSGAPCVDVNECATGAPCGAGLGTCANIGGSYACMCNAGYGAPTAGGTCAELNECALGTDDCTDAPAGICTNTTGSFTCACAAGFPYGTRTARGPSGCLARFTNLGDGTVRDNNGSGLEWQQSFSPGTQNQAASVTYCTSLALDGGGWRLPTRDELLSIVDSSRTSPSIDTSFFPGTPTEDFWSSSPVAGSPTRGWSVDFFFSLGVADNVIATDTYRARCVR